MAFTLPELPYPKDALAPVMSAETLEFHHGKHHNAYVTKLNELVQGTEFANMKLEEIIKKSNGPIFNNAAQVWNHTFFWHCLSPKGGGAPKGKVADAIKRDFGSFEEFQKKFSDAAVTQFGSGWAWLVKKNDKLEVMKTPNAENPMVHGATALLTCDVWEHAYYIDYRNARPKFVESFWKIVNWDYVEQNFNA